MKFAQVSALSLVLLSSERALAQGETRATENDSLSALSPGDRYAQICPGPHDAGTGAIVGRVRDIDDSTMLANATVSTQWIDVKRTTGHLSSASAKTNSSGFFLLCGVPAQLRLNLRSERGGYVGSPAQLALDDRLIISVDFALRRIDRAASDTLLPLSKGAQKLAAVAIDEKAVLPSWMERSGFEQRRKMGLGAFLTAEEIGRHGYVDLASILTSARGINLGHSGGGGGRDLPFPFMLGIADITNGGRCLPNVFLDGAPFTIIVPGPKPAPDRFRFQDLMGIARPDVIKGIEIYSNPGTIPAQYDLTSSTGCGSIVIWTR
jgi:hypothetical protein